MPDDTDDIARRALSIAAALAAADPGDKAEARRMTAGGAPVFWRQVARLGIPLWQEPLWLRFTRMLALLTPATATRSVHDAAHRLGAVLADGGVSEPRFARLLAARSDARLDALERAIRMVARQRPQLDVVGLAHVVFDRDGGRLARDYDTRLDRAPAQEVDHVC